MKRKAYIAKYPLDETGNDLKEIILFSDSYWSPFLRNKWNELISNRNPADPMLQGWYSDDNQVDIMASTNQPFILD